MGEMIQVLVGQAGHRIGYSFWQQLVQQHHLDNQGKPLKIDEVSLGKIHTFFSEDTKGEYKARNIFADMNSRYVDQIYNSPLSNIFRFENYCYDEKQTRNLFPIGYRSIIKESIADSIRREVEQCDRLAGFQFVHSICGGSGSGLGSLVLDQMHDHYPQNVVTTLSGIPSHSLSDIVVQPYNAILGMQKLIHSADGCPSILFQNEALFKAQEINNRKQKGSFENINKMLAVGMANLNSSMRFPCDGNIGPRKMTHNLIFALPLKFFSMSMASQTDPFNSVGNSIKHKIFNTQNWSLLVNKNKKQAKYKWFSNYFIYRGNKQTVFGLSSQIATEYKRKTRVQYRLRQFSQHFMLTFLPDSHIISVVRPSSYRPQNTITSIQNNSLICQISSQMHERVTKMLFKGAYLHSYLTEGIERDQITEAQSSLIDMSSTYQGYTESCHCCGEEQYLQ